MSKRAEHLYEFGRFRLDPAQRILLRDGELVPLTPKVFDLLLLLVENNGHLVGKEELISAIWPDTFIEESSLTKNVSILRKLLGEGAASAVHIETLSKRGYRLAGDVRRVPNIGETELVVHRHLRARLVTTEVTIADDSEEQAHGVRELKATGADVRTLAVLPFRTIGKDQAGEYLGLGLADVLITQLGNTGEIVVRPTSAVLKYAESRPDSITVGSELGVDAIVEGSVQLANGRLRVTVQMVGVRDGVTLWADKFNAELTDIFAVQDSISGQVAHALTLKLTGAKRERLRKRYTENAAAYESYLKGRYFWNKRNIEGFRKAVAQFEAAIEVDPTYALAYAGLSDTYVLLASWGEQSPREALPRARAAAAKSLEIDEELCEGHASLGNVLYGMWDLAGAEAALKRAIELNPNYATAHNRYAQVLVSLRRFDEAIAEMERAHELDPLSAMVNTAIGSPYFYAGQYDRAVKQYRQVLELEPDFVPALFSLSSALSQMGCFDEALEAARKVVEITGRHPLLIAHLANMYAAAGLREEAFKELDELLSGDRPPLPYALSLVYARLGDSDRAIALLEEAYEMRNTHLHDLNIDPEFELLRSDQRFTSLARRVGLDPYTA
jgi:TolB-like protein/DNA-binding winged helix-turn-helix (wHTH) protein/Flp pilus assembly protein TadD